MSNVPYKPFKDDLKRPHPDEVIIPENQRWETSALEAAYLAAQKEHFAHFKPKEPPQPPQEEEEEEAPLPPVAPQI